MEFSGKDGVLRVEFWGGVGAGVGGVLSGMFCLSSVTKSQEAVLHQFYSQLSFVWQLAPLHNPAFFSFLFNQNTPGVMWIGKS